ncbi:MAG: redoxin domain-containing protein [Bacteroidia bacterium]
MRKLFSTILISILCISATSDLSVYSVKVADATGHAFELDKLRKNKLNAFVFLLTDCPASQYYTLTLNGLEEKYHSQGVEVIAVFSGKFAKAEEIQRFQKDYKLKLSVLLDSQSALAKKFGATIAPEVFLADKQGKTIYSGRIDDTYYAPGRKKTKMTSADLQNAIDHFLSGKTLEIKSTKAIGCILEF